MTEGGQGEGEETLMNKSGMYLAIAFIIAFSVLLFLPVWAVYVGLIPRGLSLDKKSGG